MDGALNVVISHQASKVVWWWRDLNFLLKEDIIWSLPFLQNIQYSYSVNKYRCWRTQGPSSSPVQLTMFIPR